ncbi:MAG: alpha/beta hydrolase, partial [Chloroflexi bacterium]|nr:alpha/beta hydrolase [Chloroflexota bacterium]
LVIVDIGPGRRPSDPPPSPPPPDVEREESPNSFGSLEEAAAWMRRTYPSRSLELCRHRVFHNTRPGLDGRLVWKWDPHLYLGFRSADDLWPLLPNVRCPVLLLRGAESTVLSAAVAAETQRALAHCTLLEIPDVGHNIYTDRPEAFTAAVAPFLQLS